MAKARTTTTNNNVLNLGDTSHGWVAHDFGNIVVIKISDVHLSAYQSEGLQVYSKPATKTVTDDGGIKTTVDTLNYFVNINDKLIVKSERNTTVKQARASIVDVDIDAMSETELRATMATLKSMLVK